MATMKQIAGLAGVSLGTVDRVLNNRGSVNAETAKRIMSIAQSLDYIPNKTAQCLAVRKKNIRIGCIIINPLTDAFYAQVESGIQRQVNELADYNISVIIYHIAPNDPQDQNRLLDKLYYEDNVKGIVLYGYNLLETAKKIDWLSENGIPVITACTDIVPSKRVAYVGSDSKKSGRVAGQLIKLIGGDYARVGLIVYGEENLLNFRPCVDSFEEYAKENSSKISISTRESNFNDDFKSYAAVLQMMKQDENINVIFVLSAGVYGACKALEDMPEDKRPRLVCLNYTPATRDMLKAGIISASIMQDPEYQGRKPLDILFNLLCYNVQPHKEKYFSDIDITIGESLPD